MNEEKSRKAKALSKAAFDAQAKTYDKGMEGDHARQLYRIVADKVTQACSNIHMPHILDLGCGTGALAEIIQSEIPNCSIVGIDLSPRMVEQARTRLDERVEITTGDAEHLPFPDSSFDVVYCNDSFHHYPDPALAAFQAWRVLRAGGTFVIGDVWQPAPARMIMNAWMPHSKEGDVRIYSETEMETILGRWFNDVCWQRVKSTACVVTAQKGR